MIKALKKLADKNLKRNIASLQAQYNDKEYSIEELEELIDNSFEEFSNAFNALAKKNSIDIKLISNPTNEANFTIIENEEELYIKSQIDSTHALREEEFIPTMGKRQEEIKLFVSYSRKDREDVELLISELEKTPYPFVFWKDDQNLVAGENFKGDIQEAIKECDFGLLMVSENFESEFIVEYELPHFLEMRSSEISKIKASVPLFIRSKDNAINKLNYINDETFIFAHNDRGFIESRERELFVDELVSEIFKRVEREEKKQRRVLDDLLSNNEVEELNRDFIPTKASFDTDVVLEIKEWSSIIVATIENSVKNLHQKIRTINSKIDINKKEISTLSSQLFSEEAYLDRLKEELSSKDFLFHFRKDELQQKEIVASEVIEKLLTLNYKLKNKNSILSSLQKNRKNLTLELEKIQTSKNLSRYFALLGDSGMGKTWSCMKVALELQGEKSKLKPIYLDLRKFASSTVIEKEFNWKEIIQIVLNNSLYSFKNNMSVDTVFNIIKGGNAFVIFDGLDEVTVHLGDDRRANAFIEELKKVVLLNCNNKILFSCRTHYFRTLQEQFSMLSGQDREQIQNKDFMSLELLPFSWSQIEEYCLKKQINFNIFKKIITTIHNLEEISQRPYSLKLITLQIEKLEKLVNEGKEINSSDIYLNIIEESLNRDSGKHTLSKVHKPLIMQELSAYMWKEQLRELEYPKLDKWFDIWLYDNPSILSCYNFENREKLKADLRGATFIVRPGSNIFKFSHTSFQEFFLAQYLFLALEENEIEKFNINVPSKETLEFFIMLWKRSENQQKYMKSFNEIVLSNSYMAFEIYLVGNSLNFNIVLTNKFSLRDLDFSERIICGKKDNYLNLNHCDFMEIKFNNTKFKYINFIKSTFVKSDFSGSFFEEIDLSNSIFFKSKMGKKNHYHVNTKGILYLESFLSF